MKTLALLLVPIMASAAPLPKQAVANMVAQSEAVMKAGVCAVANDPNPRPNGVLVLLPEGPRRISAADYDYIRNAGYAKGKSGRFVMSERIETACKVADSGKCLAARALWSRQPLSEHQPSKVDR